MKFDKTADGIGTTQGVRRVGWFDSVVARHLKSPCVWDYAIFLNSIDV